MLAALALAAASGSTLPNLMLISIDTLRADRVGCYGADVETPVIDRLAREGVLLDDATVHAPQTRPSHVSMLSGRYPHEHGVRDNFSPALRPDLPTLATLLAAQGYDTAAFVGAFPLAAASGLDRGFDVYDDVQGGGEGGTPLAERRGEQVVSGALRWLGRTRSRPFFAFVHLYDPHAPYEPPAPYASRYAGRPYEGEVAYSDAQVGRLLGFLDERRLRERTLVVVTSDHGEGLGEHGEDEHLVFVYETTLRVPLVLSFPGTLPSGRRLAGQFRSVDLLPTLLELLGAKPVASSGTSRAAQLKAGARLPDNESYAESLYGQLHFGWAPLRALRAEGLKYIDAPRPELYDLRNDPTESRNLVDTRSLVASRMRERLGGFDSGSSPATLESSTDAGTIERLVSLGYVGAAGAAPGSAKGGDPKDEIGAWQAYSRDVQKGIKLFRAGDLDGSLAVLERLAKRPTASFEVEFFRGRALLRRGHVAEAVDALLSARSLLPRVAAVYVDLAQALRLQGRLAEARSAVNDGLAVGERNAALWEEGGLVAQQMGDPAAAKAALETARALDPASVRARLALSALYRDAGQLDAAIQELRTATQRAPRSASAWNALGVLLRASGDAGAAAQAFEGGLQADPDDPDLLNNLGALHLDAGRPKLALPVLERLVVVAPRFEEGRDRLERARQLLAPAPAGSARLRLIRVRDRQEAETVEARLAAGADFAAEARAVSVDPSAVSGGDLGVVTLAELAEPLRAAATALGPGARTGILELPQGYAILLREP